MHGRGFVQLRVCGNWFLADVTSKNDDVLASLAEIRPTASDIFQFADSIELTG
jgi:hypothetical protein